MVFAARTGRTRSVGKGCSGFRQQARLLFGEDLGNGTVSSPGQFRRCATWSRQSNACRLHSARVVNERPAQKDSRT